MLARIKKSKICGTIFSCVYTEWNFGFFTFVWLRQRSAMYRVLHTSHRNYSPLYAGLPSTLSAQSVDSVVLDLIGKNKSPFRMDANWICLSSIIFVTYAWRTTHVGAFDVVTLYYNRTHFTVWTPCNNCLSEPEYKYEYNEQWWNSTWICDCWPSDPISVSLPMTTTPRHAHF